MSRAWIDISRPLGSGTVVWPGDPPVRVERISTLAGGGESNLSVISTCLHAGTHVDSPLHVLEGGLSVASMPLDALVGPARVIATHGLKAIQARELQPLRIRRGERVLFKTRGSGRRWRAPDFCPDYVYLAPDAAALLAEREVRAVGIDYLSIGARGEEGCEVHRVLLRAGVWIIEGLDLAPARPGRYDLICLPLKVLGADGAPARAILRPRG